MNTLCRIRKASIVRAVAQLALLAAAGAAQAQVSYTFQSPALDATGFTLTFAVPQALSDGLYQWATHNLFQVNTYVPLGFSYSVTDGYTTDTNTSDLAGFQLTVLAGKIIDYVVSVSDTAAPVDPYYGYTTFVGGSTDGNGYTQLQDAADPGIVGLDYNGHHIPVASGGPGVWTTSVAVAPVPEPSTYALMAAGLALAGFSVRRRKGTAEQ